MTRSFKSFRCPSYGKSFPWLEIAPGTVISMFYRNIHRTRRLFRANFLGRGLELFDFVSHQLYLGMMLRQLTFKELRKRLRRSNASVKLVCHSKLFPHLEKSTQAAHSQSENISSLSWCFNLIQDALVANDRESSPQARTNASLLK